MVDFKKLLRTCCKVLNPDAEKIQDFKFCNLPRGHEGECSVKEHA